MGSEPDIIHAPGRQPAGQRTFYRVVTLVVWLVYAWLWLPLATLLLWIAGVRLSAMELYLQQQRIDPVLLFWLPVLLLVCASVLIGWAEYNRRRFSGRERRKARADVSREEVASALQAPPELARALAGSRSVTLVMDEHGRPLALQGRQPAPASGFAEDADPIVGPVSPQPA